MRTTASEAENRAYRSAGRTDRPIELRPDVPGMEGLWTAVGRHDSDRGRARWGMCLVLQPTCHVGTERWGFGGGFGRKGFVAEVSPAEFPAVLTSALARSSLTNEKIW